MDGAERILSMDAWDAWVRSLSDRDITGGDRIVFREGEAVGVRGGDFLLFAEDSGKGRRREADDMVRSR